jgi:hypothetical protein
MIWELSRLTARPAVSWSAGSRLGMKVRRAGALIALSEDDTATRAYSSQTDPSPANACAASPADTAARPLVATSTSLRRSTASAMAPPSSPIVTVGTICATPIAPTASDERVMSYTCSGTANMVSAPPTADNVDPIHSRRKSGNSRSGLMSASSRPARAAATWLLARRITGPSPHPGPGLGASPGCHLIPAPDLAHHRAVTSSWPRTWRITGLSPHPSLGALPTPARRHNRASVSPALV